MGQGDTNAATLDLNGFNQSVGDLISSVGASGLRQITNTSLTPSTLTLNTVGTPTYGSGAVAIIAGNLEVVKDGSGIQTLAGANTFTGGLKITEGTVILGNTTAASTGTITFDTGGATDAALQFSVGATITNPITVATGSIGVNTIANVGTGNVVLNSAITIDSGTTFTLDGSSSNNSTFELGGSALVTGGGAIVATGTSTGNFVFRGVNTYSGGTSLSGSGLFVPATSSTGSGAGTIDGVFGTGTLTLGDISIRSTNGADTTIGNTLVLGGNITGVTVSTEKSLTFSGPATLTGNRVITSTVGNTVAGKSLIFSGGIGDGGNNYGITKEGTGNLTFSAVTTYTGATTINGGNLILADVNALNDNPGVNGTSGVSLAAGTSLQATAGAGSSTTVSAPITLSGGANTSLIIGNGAASTTTTFNLNGVIGGTTGNLVFSTGTASFGNGSSVFILGAANNYTGNTLITTGNGGNNPVFVRNGVINALPTTTVLSFGQVNGGGTGRNFQYDLNGFDQTLAGLDNGGIVPQVRRMQVTNNSLTPVTLTINNTSDFIFGGSTISTSVGTIGSLTRAQILGNLALTKSGAGTFTLGGTLSGGATPGGNTFTGATTILGGVLVLGETIAIQNSPLDTLNSVAGDAANGLRTTVTELTFGGLTGNKNLADVFTTTAGGYDAVTGLTLNPGTD
jgi:autotransporter-associated beta strand protein